MKTKQLELFRVVIKEPEQPANPWLEKFLEEGRKEAAEFLEIANELFDQSWQNLADVSTPELREVRSEFNRRYGLPPPVWEIEGWESGRTTNLHAVTFYCSSKLYKPWTYERKVRGRLRRLHERIQKKWSLIDLKQNALFEAVLDNPQYFGVCPLPGSIESSRITLPNFAKEAAIAYEMQLKEIESGRLQPVNIPRSD